jgi:hypothetical protein
MTFGTALIHYIYVHSIRIIEQYVSVYEGMYICAHTKEAAAHTAFMAWPRAC